MEIVYIDFLQPYEQIIFFSVASVVVRPLFHYVWMFFNFTHVFIVFVFFSIHIPYIDAVFEYTVELCQFVIEYWKWCPK